MHPSPNLNHIGSYVTVQRCFHRVSKFNVFIAVTGHRRQHGLAQVVRRAKTACTFSTSQLPKVLRTWRALTLFTSKCASHHIGVHVFNISTSKSAPRPCFDTFYCKMYFAPRRRAIFHVSSAQMSLHPPL